MKHREYYYRNDLPHYLPNDRPYFLTFRLAGSNPTDTIALQTLLVKRKFIEYDKMLHSMKSGPHHLRDPRVARCVAEAIHFRDSMEYSLLAYTLMSNHVHMVIDLFARKDLVEVMQRLKTWTARACNSILGISGPFWQHEGYDHVVRAGRTGYAIAYVLNNPVKSGLVSRWQDHPWTYLHPEILGFE